MTLVLTSREATEVGGTSQALARIFVCLLGLMAVAWGYHFLPLFWRQTPPDWVATELLRGRTFNDQVLLREVNEVEASEQPLFCDPAALRTIFILRLGILRDAITAVDRKLIDSAYIPLHDAARTALTCAPTDSFAWLVLFWLDAAKHGLQPNNVNYLQMSYALAPNEEWIALWRNRLAMAVFTQLPENLVDDAINEFVGLVNTGQLYQETATIFASAAPAVEKRIVARLKSAGSVQRQIFARTLYDEGLDVDIPGVAKPTRPWQ
jgi:hypothetical protein